MPNDRRIIFCCFVFLFFAGAGALRADEAEDAFQRGNESLAQGRLEDAAAAYEQSIQSRPDAWVAHNNLGLVRQRQRQYEKAAASFQEALRLAPDHPDIHLSLGNVYNYLERWEDAIAHLNIVVHQRQDDAVAHGNLGWAYYNYTGGPPFKYLTVINLRRAAELLEAQNMPEAAAATRQTLAEASKKFGFDNMR